MNHIDRNSLPITIPIKGASDSKCLSIYNQLYSMLNDDEYVFFNRDVKTGTIKFDIVTLQSMTQNPVKRGKKVDLPKAMADVEAIGKELKITLSSALYPFYYTKNQSRCPIIWEEMRVIYMNQKKHISSDMVGIVPDFLGDRYLKNNSVYFAEFRYNIPDELIGNNRTRNICLPPILKIGVCRTTDIATHISYFDQVEFESQILKVRFGGSTDHRIIHAVHNMTRHQALELEKTVLKVFSQFSLKGKERHIFQFMKNSMFLNKIKDMSEFFISTVPQSAVIELMESVNKHDRLF